MGGFGGVSGGGGGERSTANAQPFQKAFGSNSLAPGGAQASTGPQPVTGWPRPPYSDNLTSTGPSTGPFQSAYGYRPAGST